MPKGKIIHDSFERIAELGQSITKKGSKQAVETFSPINIIENLTTSSTSKPIEKEKEKTDHTPIDINTLKSKYEEQDKQKENVLRNRLFRLVKSGDEQELEKKQAENRKKTAQEQQEEQEKIEKEKKIKESQSGDIPQGKQRRSIFSPKAKAQREHAETRPAVGKS